MEYWKILEERENALFKEFDLSDSRGARVLASWKIASKQLREKAEQTNATAKDFQDCLDEAYSLLKSLDWALHQNEEISTGKISEVWRHQPINVVAAGNSNRGISIWREQLIEVAARYLNQKKLRTELMDWIFIDSILFAEIDAFSNSVMSGPPWGPFNWAFMIADGNELKYYLLRPVFSFLGFVVRYLMLPAIAIALYWQGYQESAEWAAGAFAIYLGLKILSIPRALARWRQRTKNANLIKLMISAYGFTEPPVLNPLRLKVAVDAAIAEGAVFSTVGLSIIDRLVSIDPIKSLPFGLPS